ncbi:Ubiquitin protein [Spatholobus suberectus]|nr:Ubiquitin protein [Spatholobus suberectus]
MDVSFVLNNERTFSIVVGFFESFRDDKGKVDKYKGIPVSKKKLLFNGQVLQDNAIIIDNALYQKYCIQFLIASNSDN